MSVPGQHRLEACLRTWCQGLDHDALAETSSANAASTLVMNALERNRTEITAGAGFGAMSKTAADILLTFPPRSLGPGERALVDEWLGRAGDVAMAYVSER